MYDNRFTAAKVLTLEESERRRACVGTTPMPEPLAHPHEPWRHLAPLRPGDKRRHKSGLSTVRIHPSFAAAYESSYVVKLKSFTH